jgi:hypothetical protein
MSRASSQPATIRADIIPAGKDWLSIADIIAARLRRTSPLRGDGTVSSP